jgi:NAD(P)-dependent dehydrogenase (short-subunit alcohol dehydrogenase family)
MAGVALITGATRGLGQAVANTLQVGGWKLALVGRDNAKSRGIYGSEAVCIEAGVSTYEGVQATVTACQERLDLPTALASCAGSILISPLHHIALVK